MDTPEKNTMNLGRIKDMAYPIALIAFALIIMIVFFAAARFLSTNINSAIASPDETRIKAQLMHVNTDDYDRVGAKLHLPPLSASSTEPSGTTTLATEATTTPVSSPIEPTTPQSQRAPSKAVFSLAVFNSTKKSGIASTVKNDLVLAGFTVAKTGNKTPQEPQTTVQIKEQVQASPAILEEILSIIEKRFTVGDPQILDSTSPYDIVITIGVQ